MSALKAHHLSLLSDLVRSGGASADDLDGRMLRPLKTAGLVVERAGRVIPTPTGRNLPSSSSSPGSGPPVPASDPGPLSDPGADALRVICRTEGGVLADHMDGRVLRALLARAFVGQHDGWVIATDAGKEYYQNHIRRRRRTLAQFDSSASGARAVVLHKHIDGLEGVLPAGVELRVGDLPCHADDILAALRTYARSLEQRGALHPG